MPWLLASPGHQHPWYWLCRIGMFFSYLGKDFNHLCHVDVEEWHEIEIYVFLFPLKNLARKGLKCHCSWSINKYLYPTWNPGCNYFWVLCTVYPKKYAHGFVVLCFVVVMQSFIMNSHEVFIHIHQGCFAGTGAIVRLPQCQWSKPDGYGEISQCITTTKHSKAKTVCIFLGIYCKLTTTAQHVFIWKAISKPMAVDNDFLTWILIGWRLWYQPIRRQVSNLLLSDMNFNMDFL